MRLISEKRIGIALIAVAVLVGAIIQWLQPDADRGATATGTDTNVARGAAERTVPAEKATPTKIERPTVSNPTREKEAGLAELSLDDLLVAEIEDSLVVAELIRRLPAHHGDGHQYLVASHIANIADDEDYSMVEQLILDPEELEDSALDVLMADLNMRIEEVKLPTFARISLDEAHPSYSEAFSSLRTYFEEDGEDLTAWQTAALAYTGPPPFDAQ